MTPILSSTKMIQQLANPLFKQDLVKNVFRILKMGQKSADRI